MIKRPIIVWFRRDLRMADNPALHHAVACGAPVVPAFIHDPASEAPWQPGAASNWWLHHSLTALDESIHRLGSRLIIRHGDSETELLKLARESHAEAVLWNRRYEPAVIERDLRIKSALIENGLEASSFNSALLHEPWTIKNKSGKPFQVFTPFWKTCLATEIDPPQAAPTRIPHTAKVPSSLALSDLQLLPGTDWTTGLHASWSPGESNALAKLQSFLTGLLSDYADTRNFPGQIGTSRLSPHLHFGEISPRQIWHATRQRLAPQTFRESRFLAEIGWREFAHHLLHHFPHTTDAPLRPEFQRFPWRRNPDGLRAWQRGQTGYPIVDAGMRELWNTGSMHNRVRMIAASFLVKDLLIDWREGAKWFWDTLVDADLASNTLGWQWTAGCGADAAPFFRIFNPTSQGEKFDPDGVYVRHWVPELKEVPVRWIHQPWNAPESFRRDLRYPAPIIAHAIARNVALEAFQNTRRHRPERTSAGQREAGCSVP